MLLNRSATSRPVILIVEDDVSRQRLLSRAVELADCTPWVATSDLEGYGVLAEHAQEIALLLLDLTTQGIDAHAFRQLQLDAPRSACIPAIVMSDRRLSDAEAALLHPAASVMTSVGASDLGAVVAAYAHRGGRT